MEQVTITSAQQANETFATWRTDRTKFDAGGTAYVPNITHTTQFVMEFDVWNVREFIGRDALTRLWQLQIRGGQ